MLHKTIAQYEELGVSKRDLVEMLILRPAITRTSFDDEKMVYISRIGVLKDAKLYKYLVTLIGISRVEIIHAKVLNLTKFGLSDDEIVGLFDKSPNIMTLSTDKVQWNRTFILGTMKTVLKSRVLPAMKIQDMDFKLKTRSILEALRMSEERF
jgi:mTERF domain-containing protein, mitochondrial